MEKDAASKIGNGLWAFGNLGVSSHPIIQKQILFYHGLMANFVSSLISLQFHQPESPKLFKSKGKVASEAITEIQLSITNWASASLRKSTALLAGFIRANSKTSSTSPQTQSPSKKSQRSSKSPQEACKSYLSTQESTTKYCHLRRTCESVAQR